MHDEDMERRLRAVPCMKMTPEDKEEVLQTLHAWQPAGRGSNGQLRKPTTYVYPVFAAAVFLSVVSVAGLIYHEHVTQGTPYILHDWHTQPADLASDSNYSHEYPEAVAVPIHAFVNGQWTNETFHCVPDSHGQWKIAYDFLNNFEFLDVPHGTASTTKSTH